jgi:transposase
LPAEIAACTEQRHHHRANIAVTATATAPQTDDIEALRTSLKTLASQGRADDVIEMLLGLLVDVRNNNTQLAARLQKALRQLYGRKSEKIDPAQLSLLLASLGQLVPKSAGEEADDSVTKDGLVPTPSDPPKRLGGRKPRRQLPNNLPREKRRVSLSEAQKTCSGCGKSRPCIGYIRSEILEFMPAHFKIIEQEREKVACPTCDTGVTAAPCEKVMERGLPGPGLLANILTSKGQDGMPLYRQAQMYKRSGVSLSESTLGDWAAFAADVIAPVADRLRHRVVGDSYIRADDTGLRVLDRDHPHGVKRGHLWAYVAGRMVVFQYAPDWKADHPMEFLRDFRGHLQGDGYAGFDKVLEPPEGMAPDVDEGRRLGCGMHIRRKFEEAATAGDARGAIAMAYFVKIYRIEAACKADGLTVDERHARRQIESLPIVDEMYRWIHDVSTTIVPGTLAHAATRYAINQEQRWRLCFSDGRFEIDNGEVERQLRRVGTGRKNYLFAGSDKGAERIATAYTVLGTCHMNGINPLAYLTDVIDKIQNGWPAARLDELLPDRWIPPTAT